MNATTTAILVAILVGYFGYKNYSLNTALREAQASISTLEGSVASARREAQQAEKAKVAELKRLRREMAVESAKREKLGATIDAVAEKNRTIEEKEARIDELEAQVDKARDIMEKQKESLTWYKAEMRKTHDRLTTLSN